MKKILQTLCLAFCLLPLATFAQTVKGTLADKGGNKVGVYGQASAALNNVLFRNILITLSIADQGAGNPTDAQIVLQSGIPNLDLVPTVPGGNPYILGGRAYYSFNMSDNGLTTTSTWPAGRKDNLIADFTFPSNSYFSSLRLDDISSSGGPNGQMYWYVEVIGAGDITDYSMMFFGTPTIPPTNNGGTSPSFVPLQPFSVIPVKFSSFTVAKVNNNCILKWEVVNEDANTDRYELERSLDGTSFTTFATVLKSASANPSKTYTSTDESVASRVSNVNGIVYYRVKEIDRDGRFVYTDIKNVRFGGSREFGATIFPNPVKDLATVNIDLVQPANINIIITDATGKELQRVNMDGTQGGNTRQVNVRSLPSGTYLMKISAGAENKVLSFVKGK